MDLDDQFEVEHLVFTERKCRVCGIKKNLVEGFYLTRKDRNTLSSSYSYECKDCTKKRIILSRITNSVFDKWEYPDW